MVAQELVLTDVYNTSGFVVETCGIVLNANPHRGKTA